MASFVSFNPSTGAILGEYPIAKAAEVACVLEQAERLQERWATKSVKERCLALKALHAILASNAACLAEAITREIGKPLQEAYGADILTTLNALEWLEKSAPRTLRAQTLRGARKALLTPVAYGVVGVIGTWNYPVFLNAAPIAWALATGNVVVWKPSELATGVATLLTGYCEEAGLPVLMITGDGTTGRTLCRAGCDKIVFTGSAANGRAILKELAANGTPSVMELSGNDAMLVCADADIPLAARSAVWGRISNAGQSCVAPQRIYVEEEVYDRFLTECHSHFDRLHPGTDFGPLRTDALRRHAHTLVWDAVTHGATLLAGGRNLDERPGFFYAPTLLAGCHDGMRIMAQDFFGPVLTVCRVHDAVEAIAHANDHDLALGASIWTRNQWRGRQIAEQLQVGMVALNDILRDAANPTLPFGGLRASGFGKQRGVQGLEEFIQWRVVSSYSSRGSRRHLFPYRPATIPILQSILALKAAKSLAAKWQALRKFVQSARLWYKEAGSQQDRE
ncbi:MAG TPA: aldehyde dehydrogenase family protein [Chthonomonadaceae bacterium]|nr:aldehyde dehydrogenase family protein [Chthonomonadaceae bacterium]